MNHFSTRSSAPVDPSHAWILRMEPPLVNEPAAGDARRLLEGLSFAVKDNIDVAGHRTTAGCPSFSYVPQESATVVHKLLHAGARLVGKTNLDQFACGLSGVRSPFGEVPNAFDPRYVCGGSSSGSAYAVATGQVDFALGTDTAGSGRVPAGLNNIVGFKPTRGRISAHGVVPAAQSVDAVSVLARTVPLAWRVLQSAAGMDPQDPYARDHHELPWRTRPLGPAPRIGIPRQLEFFGDELARKGFEDAVQRLIRMGAVIVKFDYQPFAEAAELLYGSALVAERYLSIREFFDHHESDIIEPVRSIIGGGRRFTASDVLAAQRRLRVLAAQVRPLWNDMDLMMVPTTPTHITRDAMRADPVGLNRRLGYYTNFVNLLDYAAVSVPSSIRSDGLPFGVTFIGQAGSDWCLADWGTQYHSRAETENDLPLGCTSDRLAPTDRQPPAPPTALPAGAAQVQLAVVGAHLSGMSQNHQLTERGGRLLRATVTAPVYRLYELKDSEPPRPGLVRVPEGQGVGIKVEIWSMPVDQFGSFVAAIPSPLGIGRLLLADGGEVSGFLCEFHALAGAADISAVDRWKAHVPAVGPEPRPPVRTVTAAESQQASPTPPLEVPATYH